jgi:hypothetical protein
MFFGLLANGIAGTPTFAAKSGAYFGVPQIQISDSTSGSHCTSYINYNTTGAQSGGNLTGTAVGTSVSITATTTIYAQIQSCPGYPNSAIATSKQYIVYGLSSIGSNFAGMGVSNPSSYTSQITTGSNVAGYTLVATAFYCAETAGEAYVVTAIYTAGTGSQSEVIDGGSYPVACNESPSWETTTYGGTLGTSTNYQLTPQVSNYVNIWYNTSGGTGGYVSSGSLSYPTWPSTVTFAANGTIPVSHYIVVTPN